MDEYISREETVKKIEENLKVDGLMSLAEEVWTDNCLKIVLRAITAVETADVQPLFIVGEHIKKRLYQTAFNTTEAEARNAIADIAGRVDWWIDELKE